MQIAKARTGSTSGDVTDAWQGQQDVHLLFGLSRPASRWWTVSRLLHTTVYFSDLTAFCYRVKQVRRISGSETRVRSARVRWRRCRRVLRGCGSRTHLGVTDAQRISFQQQNGRNAAHLAVLNTLAVAQQYLGSLDKVTRIVRLGALIATCGDVRDQPQVADATSKLLQDIFGKDKSPCRLVYGVASLPLGTPVELEIIFEVAG